MAYGLPSRGQHDWDDELNNSMEYVRGQAETAKAQSDSAISTANAAYAKAQSVEEFVEAPTDTQIATKINEDGSATKTALTASYGYELKSTLTDATFDTFLAGLPSGARVFIPTATTVTLNAAHTITQPVTIDGPGRIVDGRTNPSSPLFTLGPAASGTRIFCHLAGSVSGQYKGNHHAIRVLGTDNGAGVAPTFVTDLVLKPASISGFGSVGISAEFIKDYLFEVDVIHDMGYSGILMSSAINGAAIVHRIANLTPGTAGNVYGIHWSRRDRTDDLVRYPRSENFFGWIGEMHGASLWDGIGTHGGRNGTIGWGSMRDVKKPFDVTAATGSDGEQLFAPHDIHIIPGSADSGVTDGSMGPAGIINGAFRTDASPGTVVEYATGIKLAAGTYRGYGIESSAAGGAMIFYATRGLEADVGVLVEPSPYAANVYHDNLDFKLTVTAVDPWSNTAGVGEGSVVRVASTYNTGTITFAGGSRGSKTATYVYTRGLSVLNDATNDIRLGVSSIAGATTPISGPVVARQEAWLKLVNGIRLPDGTAASPSLTFDNDRDTGFYSSGAGQLAVAVDGVRRARWLAASLSLDYGISVGADNTYDLAGTSNKFRSLYVGTSTIVGTAQRRSGTGSPEGVVTAPVGSLYTRSDGGAGTTLYVKESGAGNTGWVAQGSRLTATATLDFPSIAAAGSQELTVTVTGAATGDTVYVGPPSTIEAGLTWNGYVSAANTVKVRVSNITASAIDPASASWKVAVVR